jgi:PIF1-like helicase
LSINVASTGIAPNLLPHGSTAHSHFKIPIKLSQTATCETSFQSNNANELRRANLIIWDEAPMTHKYALEAMDELFKDLLGNQRPFGGITIRPGGDFRQTLPILRGGSNQESVGASVTRNFLWSFFSVWELSVNMRAGPDQSSFAN